MPEPIPVALFAYNRPDLLQRTLAGLRQSEVPLIYAFSDGPGTPAQQANVEAVRTVLGQVDWCELRLVRRDENWGLGRSIVGGVSQVLRSHSTLIVVEDDLVCAPGTYAYLCAALEHYRDEPKVMSVTAWTHPRVTPADVGQQPYFDGRAECWVWGTWARAWNGVEAESALSLIRQCQRRGQDVYRYGADLPAMAWAERKRNLWAVRWLYWHLLQQGLCLRPPRSLVEHIGFDERATNMQVDGGWSNSPLSSNPFYPERWPMPSEHPVCPALWQAAFGRRPPVWRRVLSTLRQTLVSIVDTLGLRPPKPL
jgi:hypothetical protein